MKKKLSVLIATALMAAAIAGCGGGDKASTGDSSADNTAAESGDSSSSGEEVVIKVGHGVAEKISMHQGWLKFKELVEEKSGGSMKVEIYPNQMLGGDRELIEATQMGNIQMTSPSSTPLANFVPEYYLWDVPFMFETREQVFKVADNQELFDAFNEKMLAIGVRVLSIWENGFRNVSCNGERVTPEDFKGLKIRTMENDLHLAAWKAIGANPTPMAFGEVYTGLQQKTIDAQENPLVTIYETKYHEVQDHVIETKHIYTPFIVMVNEAFYQSLTDEQKTIVNESMEEAKQYEIEYATKAEDDSREALAETITVTELSAEQRAAFKTKIEEAGIKDMAIEKSGNADLAAKFFAAVDEATK